MALLTHWIVRESANHHHGPRLLCREGNVLDHYAERFAAGGLASIVFDNRNFGASDG